MSVRETDVVVIGAGPVGENVADRVVRGGLRAVIVEAELVGGECSYWACMPSKALLRTGAAHRAAQAAGVEDGRVDRDVVLRRRDSFTSGWDDSGQVQWLQSAGIDLVRGHARLAGERRVVVSGGDEEVEIVARHAVVVTVGSAARLPGIPGLAEAEPWTSREATALQTVPGSIAIIGGGVVATEAATFLADLGSRVTVLARSGLLTAFEPVAGEQVAGALRERGVDIREGIAPARVTRDEAGVQIEFGDGEPLRVDEVLVATGRVPRTEDLGLETVGLEPGEWIAVDDTLRVAGSDWLYAAGDVTHRALLTHQGKYQARAAGDVIVARATGGEVRDRPWGAHVATADHAAVPQVVFTDPEVAAVGLTAAQAQDAGMRVRVVDYDLGSVAGASLTADGYAGAARAVVDEDRRVLVGVTFVGAGVAELLHAATIAVVGEVPLERLWHAVPAYPTISEVWLRLLETYGL
ncbi:dihydrolipoyl dehydrogenase family protein [Microbacterium oryzae]|uniref:dihydrolipoyl dehydrogenase family protein n=1 Tax=Microbacterium oryzae TaxID=743009 RepID=UPI0015651AF2|nr:NAD(P)/FAD-dependent oxidoreductase [Microbacterium oryzae]